MRNKERSDYWLKVYEHIMQSQMKYSEKSSNTDSLQDYEALVDYHVAKLKTNEGYRLLTDEAAKEIVYSLIDCCYIICEIVLENHPKLGLQTDNDGK